MPIRMLLVGDSSTGKTSALLSLLKAGYKINLADFDAGTDFLRAELAEDANARARLSVKVLTDKLNWLGENTATLVQPSAIARLGQALDKWDDQGSISKWTSDTIFVIDSVSFMARAFMRQHCALNNLSLTKPIDMRQFGPIQGLILNLLDRLHDDRLPCHIILITHLDYREFESNTYAPVSPLEKAQPGRPEADKIQNQDIDTRAVPTVFGAKLGPHIGRYFNFLVHAKGLVVGKQVKKYLMLQPDSLIDLKCPIRKLGKELPLETSLATIFTAWKDLKLDD